MALWHLRAFLRGEAFHRQVLGPNMQSSSSLKMIKDLQTGGCRDPPAVVNTVKRKGCAETRLPTGAGSKLVTIKEKAEEH